MSDDKSEKMTDHDYDGIKELDNSLPRWWLGLLYISIVVAVGYYCYYELGSGPSIRAEYASDVAALNAAQAAAHPVHFPDEAKLAAAMKDPARASSGKAVFQTRCVSCHGDKGQGIIGPNLTDSYWLHGDGKIGSIAQIAHDGVSEKGMPAWGGLLSDDEIYSVAIFVRSLRGSNPPGAKAPQGQLVKE